MYRMYFTRILLPVAIFACAFSPMVLFAATTAAPKILDPKTASSLCIKKLISAQIKTKQTTANASTENSDKCISDIITIDAAGKKTITPKANMILPKVPLTADLNWCVPDACKPTLQTECATVHYSIPAIGSTPASEKDVSKCDPEQKGKIDALLTQQSGLAAQSVAQQAISGIKGTDGAIDSTKLSQALQNLGVEKEKADTISQDSSQKNQAYDMLQNLVSGDPSKVAQAQQTAQNDLGITLNPDTVNKISSLQPDGFSSLVSNGVGTEEQQKSIDTAGSAGSTFAAPQEDPNKPLPGGRYGEMLKKVEDQYGLTGKADGVLAKYMKVESGGNPNICSGSGACGLFQYTASTWAIDSARMNGGVPLSPSLRFDPETSAQVTASSVSYYLNKYGDRIDQAGLDPATGAYLIHNIGVGDGPKFIQAYANNPDATVNSIGLQSYSIANNPVNFGNGNITLAQAVGKIETNMGGTPTAASGPSYSSPAPAYSSNSSSPFSFAGEGTQTTQFQGSPFAYASPAPAYATAPVGASPQNQYSSGYPQTQYAPTQSYPQAPSYGSSGSSAGGSSSGGATYNPITGQQQYTPQQIQLNTSASTNLQQALNPGTPTSQNVPATAQIIVQATTPRLGSNVLVIWSSTGMSTNNPCTILYNAKPITARNEGSTSVTLSAVGSALFEMRCTTYAGVSVTKNKTIVVQ
ncbi:MAG: hypothetical protein JWO50_161 [Candidatus Kaiserbacteria bacterium]|nr:hypothetical protein [Candidatus Kaiserbacteria bacterium]